MENIQSRFEDMGNGILSVSDNDGIIKISTNPHIDAVTFTRSGGQSKNTFEALRKLFYEMEKDNDEVIQEEIFNESDCQSRCEDTEEIGPGFWGQLMVSRYGDMKVSVLKKGSLIFKSPEKGGKSKYLYETAKQLVAAMQKDNEERPQSGRVSDLD